jgi:hypothetical protein
MALNKRRLRCLGYRQRTNVMIGKKCLALMSPSRAALWVFERMCGRQDEYRPRSQIEKRSARIATREVRVVGH